MTDTEKPTPAPLYLIVTEERSYGYFHLSARIASDRCEDGHRWPYGLSDRYDGPLYSDLVARCQGDTGSQQSTDRESAVYGFGPLEYRERHSTDLRDAERMVKTLKSLDRGLAKLAETRGYARSYGEFIGRLAEVLKCKGIAMQRTHEHAAMMGHTWEWLSIGDGVRAIHNRIWQWQREAMRQEVSA